MDETDSVSDWASRRKNIYLGALVFILSAVSFFIFWQFWYSTPTCFDNFKNGDEAGVDCGGSCTLVCSASALKPIVKWDPRLFEISPGVWSTLVYVENPNIDTVATYAPYTFTFYDSNNNVLLTKEGATILPKNQTVGIFEGGVAFEEGVAPRRATFEFGNLAWQRDVTVSPDIKVTHSPLLRLETTPRVEATLKNNEIYDIKNIELVVAVFDGADNVIATSRTFVEQLRKDESANIFFTWPKPFDLGVKVCEYPSDIVLAIDRSGSMQSMGKNPPEPLSSVKKAASYFVSQLGRGDSVGLVSFATDSQNPASFDLTQNFSEAISAIDKIAILTDGVQYTNIADAIIAAAEKFPVADSAKNQKILVLLTDGVATRPSNPKGSKSEAEEISYAEESARLVAESIKKNNVNVYTIGLGKDVNESFLKQIASSPENYFSAPSTTTLMSIYENISSSICEEMPARIEITYKIFGSKVK